MQTDELSLYLRPTILKPRAEHGSEITRRFALNKVGRMFAAAMQDRTIRLYDVRNGEEIQRLIDNFLSTALAFSPRGDIIASGGVDRLIKLWDIRSGECIAKLEGHSYPILCLSFSPDGSHLISGSGDTTMIVWDIDNQENLRKLKGHTLYVVTCEWDPNDNRIVSGGVDGFIGVWNPYSGKRIDWLQKHRTAVHVVKFSRDGSILASGSSDLSIIVWDTSGSTLTPIHTIKGHSGEVRCLAFSDDNRFLASGSSDKDLFIWNTENYTREGESNTLAEIDGLEWLPQTHSFITADGTGSIIRWDVEELQSVLAPFKKLLSEISADLTLSRRSEFIQRFEEIKSQYSPEMLRDKRVFYVVWQCKKALGLLKGTPRKIE